MAQVYLLDRMIEIEGLDKRSGIDTHEGAFLQLGKKAPVADTLRSHDNVRAMR